MLRDELLDAFESLPDLRASEVLILAPQLDLYGPLAEAILRDGDPSLPLRLAERRNRSQRPLGAWDAHAAARGRRPRAPERGAGVAGTPRRRRTRRIAGD